MKKATFAVIFSIFFLFLVLSMGAQGASGSQDTEKSLEQSFGNIQKDLETLAESAAGLLKQKESEFREKLEQSSKELNAKDIMMKMNELKAKGLDSWEDIKMLVFQIWEDLRKTYDTELHKTDFEKT